MRECGILTFRPMPDLAARFGDERLKQTAEAVGDVIFYLLREDELEQGEAPRAEELGQDTGHSWEQIGSWLQECEERHERCRKPRDRDTGRVIPTRLLDVRSRQERTRIVNTENFSDEERKQCRYVTLSHSWGRDSNQNKTKLLSTNQEEYTTVGVPEDLIEGDENGNRNFADAIEVARRLGVQYIWVDSLCIIQDSREDWNREAPKMHQVYRGSWCNIGAAHSEGRKGGLFKNRSEAYSGQKEAHVDWRGAKWRVVPGDLWEKDLLGEVLYGRGWVFQGEFYISVPNGTFSGFDQATSWSEMGMVQLNIKPDL